jgi:hypothetical protein
LLPPSEIDRLVTGSPEAHVHTDSSFYLFDIIEQEDRAYVVALSTVWPGAERSDRLAFIIQYDSVPNPSLVCILQTTLFGAG